MCPLLKSYVEALIPNMSMFGDGAFKEVIRVKWGYKVGAWSSRTDVFIRRDNRRCMHSSKAMWGHSHREKPQEKLTLPTPWPWTSGLQNREEEISSVQARVRLWQPVQTTTAVTGLGTASDASQADHSTSLGFFLMLRVVFSDWKTEEDEPSAHCGYSFNIVGPTGFRMWSKLKKKTPARLAGIGIQSLTSLRPTLPTSWPEPAESPWSQCEHGLFLTTMEKFSWRWESSESNVHSTLSHLISQLVMLTL